MPDIPGYRTLICDFHTHTVFSDGKVWPDIRAEEAWREGLDAIAITDHIEYQPHKADLPTAHNRSYEIAKPHGDDLGVIVIRGSEITRQMPPGHLNAVFLADARALDVTEWREAVSEAHRQGAFIFWNHPGWRGQQADGVAKWYDEHTELIVDGMLHGIEVMNGREYYPEAHRWCLEKKLTMLSNSDIHSPLNLDYAVHDGDLRPVTLVFARERSGDAIREALFDRRTVVYAANRLIGEGRFLKPLFERSINVPEAELPLKGTRRGYVQIHNHSNVNFELERIEQVPGVAVPANVTLHGGRTSLFQVSGVKDAPAGRREVRARYRVLNLLVAPEQALEIEIPFTVNQQP